MKFLTSSKLSEHRYKTPEGYLVCVDAIIARTGKQEYHHNELFADSNDDSIIEVDRPYKEVFSPATIASFENKPLVDEHPDEDVNVENYKNYAVGFIRDVHEGEENGKPVLMANIIVTDPSTIEEIENGKTQLSCGYDCDILGDSEKYQANIRGNHVALCEQGRAGNARIVDSENIKDNYYANIEESKLRKSNDFKLKELFRDLDEEKRKPMSPSQEFEIADIKNRIIKRVKQLKNVPNDIYDSIKDDSLDSLRKLIKQEMPNNKKELREVYKSWARKEHHGIMYEDEFRKMCEEFNITDSVKDKRWEVGNRVRYEGRWYYIVAYNRGDWILEPEDGSRGEQIRVRADDSFKDSKNEDSIDITNEVYNLVKNNHQKGYDFDDNCNEVDTLLRDKYNQKLQWREIEEIVEKAYNKLGLKDSNKIEDAFVYTIPKGTTLEFINTCDFGKNFRLVEGAKKYTFDRDLKNVDKRFIEEYASNKLEEEYDSHPRTNWKLYNWSSIDKFKTKDSIDDVEPRTGESKEEFISRFMSETKEEYPNQKQRLAVAHSYWNRDSKNEDSVKDGAVKTVKKLDKDIFIEYDYSDKKYYIASNHDRDMHPYNSLEEAEKDYNKYKSIYREQLLEDSIKDTMDLKQLENELDNLYCISSCYKNGNEIVAWSNWKTTQRQTEKDRIELMQWLDKNIGRNNYSLIYKSLDTRDNGKECAIKFSIKLKDSVKDGKYDDYFGQEEYEKYGKLVKSRLKGKTISKRRDLSEQENGLEYEAKKLGISSTELLRCLEGMCYNGEARENYNSSYTIKDSTKDADDRLYEQLLSIAENYNKAKQGQSNSRTTKSDLRYISNKHEISSDLRNKYKEQWNNILKTLNKNYQQILGFEPSVIKANEFKKLRQGEFNKKDSLENKPVTVLIVFEDNKEANDALKTLQRKEEFMNSDFLFDNTIKVETTDIFVDKLKKDLKLFFVKKIIVKGGR